MMFVLQLSKPSIWTVELCMEYMISAGIRIDVIGKMVKPNSLCGECVACQGVLYEKPDTCCICYTGCLKHMYRSMFHVVGKVSKYDVRCCLLPKPSSLGGVHVPAGIRFDRYTI